MKNKFLTLCGLFVLALAFMGCRLEANTPTVTSIQVDTEPSKVAYTVGDSFSATGLKIAVVYSDNSTKLISYSSTSGITLSKPDMATAGEKTVTVTYEEKTTTFKIKVNPKQAVLNSITVKTLPTKTTYTVGDAFDPSGLVITTAYSDSSSKDVTYNATSGITLSSPEMTSKGEKTVTVTYSGKTTTFTITVNEKQSSPTPETESTSYILIDGTKMTGSPWALAAITLTDFSNKTVTATFSAKEKIESTSTEAKNLLWQINTGKNSYPIIASCNSSTSAYTEVTGTKDSIETGDNPIFYLSGSGITATDFKIYLKDFKLTVTDGTTTKEYTAFDKNDAISTVENKGEDKTPETPVTNDNWLSSSVPSIYETYKDHFDSIGIAAEYGNFGIKQTGSNKYTATYTHDKSWGTPSELYYEEVQNGIKKHANSITLGNELKPQFLLQWWSGDGSSQTMVDFTASNGKTIKVPNQLNGEKLIYATLNACKAMNVQMRGHVLTWHSQTPDGFFAVGYKPEYNGDLITNLVDAETMTARHEWYIKTVLDCVSEWEKANNYTAIWAWDVVNEAMADDAGKTYTGTSQDWLRGSTAGTKDKSPSNGGGSRWYQVYGNEEFIVNAFRFANAYAPSTVKLCYNDYNEYWDAEGHYKTSAIEHIFNVVKAGEAKTVNGKSVAPRIDVIAMQSHVGSTWPGVTGYETALKRFLALADVHVSEIDFSAETMEVSANCYKDYFTMLQKYGKKSSGTHKVTNVTIWGINNESSWINPSSAGGKKTYPLLFNLDNKVTTNDKTVTFDTGAEVQPKYDIGDTYKTNDAFWAVINAHK